MSEWPRMINIFDSLHALGDKGTIDTMIYRDEDEWTRFVKSALACDHRTPVDIDKIADRFKQKKNKPR